jgi:hypothetical protein
MYYSPLFCLVLLISLLRLHHQDIKNQDLLQSSFAEDLANTNIQGDSPRSSHRTMPSLSTPTVDTDPYPIQPHEGDDESGYASGSSSDASLPDVFFTKPHLRFLNRQLQNLEPQGMNQLCSRLSSTRADTAARHSQMVYHLITTTIPDHRLRSKWIGHHRYALQTQDTPPSGRQSHLP